MSDHVSRETQHFPRALAARRCARKVDPVLFVEQWLAGTRRATIASAHGIDLTYVSALARRYGLPKRKSGRPCKLVRQAPGLVAAIRGQERRDA